VARQFGRRLRHAGALQVGGCRHAQAPVVGQAHADEAGVTQVADADGAVEALVDDVDHAVGQVQRHAHVGVLGQESRHQRRDVAAAETGRRGDAQVAAGLHAAGADAGLGIGQIGQQALAVLEKGAALVRERDAPRGAQQQLDAQALFQRIDAPADHRRRHALGARRSRQAAPGGHRNQGFDLLEPIHGTQLCIKLTAIHESRRR
jgi:hypothetical protein